MSSAWAFWEGRRLGGAGGLGTLPRGARGPGAVRGVFFGTPLTVSRCAVWYFGCMVVLAQTRITLLYYTFWFFFGCLLVVVLQELLARGCADLLLNHFCSTSVGRDLLGVRPWVSLCLFFPTQTQPMISGIAGIVCLPR